MTADKDMTGAFDAPLFTAELRPHRSLSPRGFRWLIGFLALISSGVSLPFFLIGAWPVVGFFGLDVLLLWLAFRASYAQARASEHVRLTPIELSVTRISARGLAQAFLFNPKWVRLMKEIDEDVGVTRLAIAERGAWLDIGGFLSAPERTLFAADFDRALAEARRGPRFASP